MCLGFFCCYAVRVTPSVTLEAMTNATNANPDFKVRIDNDSDNDSPSETNALFRSWIVPSLPDAGVRLGRAQKEFDIELLFLGLRLHANTRQHPRPEVDRSEAVLADADPLGLADSQRPLGRLLQRLADGRRHKDGLRSRARHRSTVSAHPAVEMGATRGAWQTL